MELGKWELDGQMDLNLWLSAQLGQEGATPTDLQFKAKKVLCGGMLTAHGLEPLSMEHLSFIQNKETPTHSLSRNAKLPFFLVNGGTRTPSTFWGSQPGLEELLMCLMHTPSMVNLVIFTIAQAKVICFYPNPINSQNL